ncbi:MAG TPA: hypothetical protein DDW27_20285 [Bacteroidales bacterium]|nr:hypothetical protein [Bacteroidales bacterium]
MLTFSVYCASGNISYPLEHSAHCRLSENGFNICNILIACCPDKWPHVIVSRCKWNAFTCFKNQSVRKKSTGLNIDKAEIKAESWIFSFYSGLFMIKVSNCI